DVDGGDPADGLLGAGADGGGGGGDLVGHGASVLGGGGEASQQGSLREVHIGRWLAEVRLRSGLDSVGAVAQVDVVQVQLEDLVLRELPFDLSRDTRLHDLPADAALRVG